MGRSDRRRGAAARRGGRAGGLLGEGAADGPDRRRDERLRTRSAELSAELPVQKGARHGTLRFTQLAVSNNVRLLAGMIRANRPARVMGCLSRSATAALGTGAYALSSSGIWTIAHASTWPRLGAVSALSMLMILVSLVVAHGLWERSADDAARERVVLFNVVTITTLAIAGLRVAVRRRVRAAGVVRDGGWRAGVARRERPGGARRGLPPARRAAGAGRIVT